MILFFLVLCLRVIPSLMFPPGPTALPTKPGVEALTDTRGTDLFTVVTGPPEKAPTMVPEALATEAATEAQPRSQTDGAEETVAETTVAEVMVAETTVAEATVAGVPVVSTVGGTIHLVTDPPVVETTAPATAAGDVKPVQTAATEAEAKPNDAVFIEEGADEVHGKNMWGGRESRAEAIKMPS